MPLRNVPITYTLDQQRQEINNLAVDVNDIDVNFNEKVDDRINALVTAGTGIASVYDDTNNTYTLNLEFSEFTTSNLTEGVNSGLFFTTPRANTAIDNRVDRTYVNNLQVNELGNLPELNLQSGAVNKQITALNYNNTEWDAAYGWGDHAAAGYVTSFSETDTLQTVTTRGASTSVVSEFLTGLKTNSIQAIVPNTDSITFEALQVKNLADTVIGSYTTGIGTDYGVMLNKLGRIVINNDGGADCFTIKKGGTTKFKIDQDGKLQGIFYLPTVDGTVGQFLKTDGTGQWGWSSMDGASVEVSDTPPGGATQGDLWWESDSGRLKVYYDNGSNPATWIDASPPLQSPQPASEIRANSGAVSANNGDVFSDVAGDFKASLTVTDYEKIKIGVTLGFLDGTANTSGAIKLQRIVGATTTTIFTVHCPQPSVNNGPMHVEFVDQHGQSGQTVIAYQIALDLGGAGNRSTGTTYGSQINIHEI